LKFFEKLAVKNAEVVLPVCDALARVIEEHRPKKVEVIPDISLLNEVDVPSRPAPLVTTIKL
jgi:hypothetical protein